MKYGRKSGNCKSPLKLVCFGGESYMNFSLLDKSYTPDIWNRLQIVKSAGLMKNLYGMCYVSAQSREPFGIRPKH